MERGRPTRGERRQAEYYASQDAQNGRIVAVALVGKRAPIKSVQEIRGAFQNILSKESPSTVQYFAEASQSTGRFNFRVASGNAAAEAVQSLPQSHSSLMAIREILADAQLQRSQQDYCSEFQGHYVAPRHANNKDLVILRQSLLAEDLSVKVNAQLRFGSSCSRLQHQIKLQGKLQRDNQMTEWAKKDSMEAQKCEEDEKRGFSVSPVCLYVAEQQAAALNQISLKLTVSSQFYFF